MNLLGILYKAGTLNKHSVVLELGRKGNIVYIVHSRELNNNDIPKIIAASKILDAYQLEDKIKWLKENIISFNKGYRELDQARIISSELLKELK